MVTPMNPAILMLYSVLLAAPALRAQQPGTFEGRPAFAEGIALGYYVWTDRDGWHVRWTTMGQMRSFTGSVTAEGEGAELKSLKRIDVESETRILYPGRPAHLVRGPRGRVVGVGGGRAPVVATREQDSIEKDGDSRIVFAAKTNNDIDGYDFKTNAKVVVLRFVLNVDGRPHPNVVEMGATNQKAASLPLIVRLR